jgi:hypothetical protein
VLTTQHLYPQKLALTSPTCSCRLVGIVLLRTKAVEFRFKISFMYYPKLHEYFDNIILINSMLNAWMHEKCYAQVAEKPVVISNHVLYSALPCT